MNASWIGLLTGIRRIHKHVPDVPPPVRHIQARKRKIPTHCQIHRHAEDPFFDEEYSLKGPPKGLVYDKLPCKINARKGQVFHWCACGRSRSQPFCDMSHREMWGDPEVKSKDIMKYRPIVYIANKDGDIWFCNCKQTKSRPLCDGSHRLDDVQEAFTVK